MSMVRSCRVMFVCLASLPTVCTAADAGLKTEVDRLVGQLADTSPRVRQGAAVGLYLLAPEALEFMEAAAGRENLAPAAAVQLKPIVERVRKWNPARLRRAEARRALSEYSARTGLESYKRVGRRDAKWDDAACEGIRRSCAPTDLNDRHAGRAALEKAIAAGCDDPFILYLEACQARLESPASEQLDQLYRRAVESLRKSDYPDWRKAAATVRYHNFKLAYVRDKWKKLDPKVLQQNPLPDADQIVLGRLLGPMAELWAGACKEPGIPPAILRETAGMVLEVVSETDIERKQIIEMMYLPMESAAPKSAATLALKGAFYIDWAWNARGGGYADTVTPEGWKLFDERLEVAREALTKAWETDPHDPDAPTQMIAVMMGLNRPRAEIETWFSRAMAADPDNEEACRKKMLYLEPKWHGSAEEMLAFGRECRDGRNWYGNIPFQLIEAHVVTSAYSQNPDDYFHDPTVWQDMQSVYEPYLAARPDSAYVRSRYAYWCCRCGQWAEARRQFDRLGDRAVPDRFGGEEELARFRQLARGNGSAEAP